MDMLDLDTITVKDEVRAAVSETVAEIYQILPLRFENGGRDLVIATAEPGNFDMLHDLSFMLSRRIKPVLAEKDAIIAAIERTYVPSPLADMPVVLREIEELDARGPLAVARDWLRRILSRLRLCPPKCHADDFHHSTTPPNVRFANHVLLATAESGAREATVEFSKTSGRFPRPSPGRGKRPLNSQRRVVGSTS